MARGSQGHGDVAVLRFRVKAEGDAGIRLAGVDARDAANQPRAIAGMPLEIRSPARTAFRPAAPNPFRATAALSFSLDHPGAVELAIYSVDGRRVRTMIRGERSAGEYRPVWDATDDHGERVPAGVYFARLSAGPIRLARTIVLLD